MVRFRAERGIPSILRGECPSTRLFSSATLHRGTDQLSLPPPEQQKGGGSAAWLPQQRTERSAYISSGSIRAR